MGIKETYPASPVTLQKWSVLEHWEQRAEIPKPSNMCGFSYHHIPSFLPRIKTNKQTYINRTHFVERSPQWQNWLFGYGYH